MFKNKSKKIVGISGNRGSFSEEAAMKYIAEQKIKFGGLKYLISAERVLQQLDKGEIDIGIFPIENSNGGIVIEAVRAMSKYVFQIEKMFEIDVKHCLLVRPGVKSAEVNRIVSHPQAIKQCRMYLKRKWKYVQLDEYSDTAEAAKDLAAGKLGVGSAVIAPAKCAEIYGLDILEEGIQDLKFNFTTFMAVRRD